MNSHVEKKLQRINELQETIRRCSSEIELLLSPKYNSPLPPDFSMAVSVYEVIISSGVDGVDRDYIKKTLFEKYSYYFEMKSIGSSIAYLKKRGKIENIKRGLYRATFISNPLEDKE